MAKEYRFNPGDFVVYPTHGVGKVVDMTKTQVGGSELELIAVNFDKAGMVVKIPMTNVSKTNLRPLSSKDMILKLYTQFDCLSTVYCIYPITLFL